MKKTLLIGLSSLIVCPAHMAVANDDPLTIVITASRSAQTVDETMAPVTIIDREEIEQSGATTVAEVLERVPSVVISSNGGVGQQTSVFLRGVESDQTLVLIDGVKVGSATLGTAPFQNLSLDQVERIEVVRGPRSSLYGSEAMGGVIQIFTRKGGDGFQPSFSIGAGSHNTQDIQAGVTGGDEKKWYGLSFSSFSTDGFNACKGNVSAGCFTVEPDDDGHENTSLSLRGGMQVNDRISIEGSLLNSDSETDFDGSFQNGSETQTQVARLSVNMAVTDNWNANVLLAKSADNSESLLNGTFASRFDTDRDQISIINDIAIGGGTLVVGGDHITDKVDSNLSFAVTSRDNTGLFASFNRSIGGGDIELSVRSDDNEQFGSAVTGGIAYGRDIGDNRLTVSYGTAFKAPTFNELYYPGFGNANLEAETSSSFDIGFSGQMDKGQWSVNVFRTEVDDLIGFDPVTFAPENINKAEITGIEAVSLMTLGEWDLDASITLLDPKDAGGGANDGNQLPRRIKRIIHLGADREFGKFTVGGSISAHGSAFDDPANSRQLDSYTLVDARVAYRIRPNWSLELEINNLLDEEYETAFSYNQDGLNAMATLRYIP